jgi:hypothetical protein
VKKAIMMCDIMDAPRQLLRRRKDKVASWPRTKFVRWRGEDVVLWRLGVSALGQCARWLLLGRFGGNSLKISRELFLSFGRGAQSTTQVVFLILKYYLGLTLCIDSYVVGFFLPLLLRQFLSCTSLTT